MTRQHRRWHRLIWSLLVPALVVTLLLGVWLRPPALENPGLLPTLENAPVEGPSSAAAPTAKTR